ncbi:MAG: ComF family protein [Alphaproteobacteria bacterium]|nr:ComF family protein [Alphaproteobacteria bacterium]
MAFMIPVASFFQQLQQSATHGLNVLLPPLCVVCEEMVGESHGFCGTCWRGFTFISPPFCSCCGLPFEYEGQSINDAALCGACLVDRPDFTAARAALVYNEASKSVLLPFKHQDRTDFARALARLLAHAGQALIEKADALMPVPLHFTRLFSRRYNQSALLVHQLAKLCGKPMVLHALARIRSTHSQGHLSREQRYSNVKNAFRVRPNALAQIEGRNLLLIDDVLTTGATANACVIALKKAGAANVDVLTLARVVKAHS